MDPQTAKTFAEAVRTACVNAALTAYEEAGIHGLCHEGRWEFAIQALRGFDLTRIVQKAAATSATTAGS